MKKWIQKHQKKSMMEAQPGGNQATQKWGNRRRTQGSLYRNQTATMKKPERNSTEPTREELNRTKTREAKNPSWDGLTKKQQQERVYNVAKTRKWNKEVKAYTRSITKKHRTPTNMQIRAAEYNYRETTGVHPMRTKAQARGYIEGYTDGLNEMDRGEKIWTIEETARLMEKRFDDAWGGEDRLKFDQTAPTYETR